MRLEARPGTCTNPLAVLSAWETGHVALSIYQATTVFQASFYIFIHKKCRNPRPVFDRPATHGSVLPDRAQYHAFAIPGPLPNPHPDTWSVISKVSFALLLYLKSGSLLWILLPSPWDFPMIGLSLSLPWILLSLKWAGWPLFLPRPEISFLWSPRQGTLSHVVTTIYHLWSLPFVPKGRGSPVLTSLSIHVAANDNISFFSWLSYIYSHFYVFLCQWTFRWLSCLGYCK